MSTNICGNCENFKPKKDERFFNCTFAKHAGVSYGMQVRADTRACDAFSPYRPRSSTPSTTMPPPIQKPAAKSARKQPDDRQRPTGLCPWGRVILIAALVIVILILAGLAYMCASNLQSSPEATPTPKSTLPPALTGGPTPTPAPAYIIQYFNMQEWAITPRTMVLITSASRTHEYARAFGSKEVAPPGMDFILVEVTVLNRLASNSVTAPASRFVLVDSASYTYSPLANRAPYLIIMPYEGTTILPTKSASGTILYVVPNVMLDLEIQYLLDSYSVPPVVARWSIPR